jgi:hypothetical protein
VKNILRGVTLVLLLAGAAAVTAAQTAQADQQQLALLGLPAQPTPSAKPQPAAQPAASLPAAGSDDGCSVSPLASLRYHTVDDADTPITGCQRLEWFITNTIGPLHLLAGGFFSAGIGTWENHPREYGPHWEGFADRFGMRLTGISTGNALEATIGSAWGEDPRYFREPERGFGGRLENVVKQTFMARHTGGGFEPAYARYIAVVGNNFMSNAWRLQSEADTSHAMERVGEGFAGRMAANAWEEFWPSISSHIFHHGK